MSKPIKCPSCNKNMYILSNAISGEGGELYSAKMECGMCMTRFCHVLQTTEERARRMTAKLTRAWIAKLKTCDQADKCAFKAIDLWSNKPNMNGDVFPALSPLDRAWVHPWKLPRTPPVSVMYGVSMNPSVTYSGDATVTVTGAAGTASTSVVKMSVDELMNLRSQGLLSDTKKEDPNEVP